MPATFYDHITVQSLRIGKNERWKLGATSLIGNRARGHTSAAAVARCQIQFFSALSVEQPRHRRKFSSVLNGNNGRVDVSTRQKA